MNNGNKNDRSSELLNKITAVTPKDPKSQNTFTVLVHDMVRNQFKNKNTVTSNGSSNTLPNEALHKVRTLTTSQNLWSNDLETEEDPPNLNTQISIE